MLVEEEGHPDNVAPALWGGFTLCWTDDNDYSEQQGAALPALARCLQLQPSSGLAAVLVCSNRELKTQRARAVLPSKVPHADAAYNVAHAGVLVAALLTGQAEVLACAMNDRLHEPYRATLIEDFTAVRTALLTAGVDGACLSGAGPTVVGLVLAADDETALVRAQSVATRFNQADHRFPDRRPAFAVGSARAGALSPDAG
jgi:homoserine kinase